MLKSEGCVEKSPVQVEEDFRETIPEPSIKRELETDNQLDFISPEAQIITDEILKEYQSSSSSIGSDLSESATEPEEQEVVNDDKELDVYTSTKHQYMQTELALQKQTHREDLERPASPTKQPTGLRPKSAECLDLQLSARSIFVDLSLTSLQAQSDNNDD